MLRGNLISLEKLLVNPCHCTSKKRNKKTSPKNVAVGWVDWVGAEVMVCVCVRVMYDVCGVRVRVLNVMFVCVLVRAEERSFRA